MNIYFYVNEKNIETCIFYGICSANKLLDT